MQTRIAGAATLAALGSICFLAGRRFEAAVAGGAPKPFPYPVDQPLSSHSCPLCPTCAVCQACPPQSKGVSIIGKQGTMSAKNPDEAKLSADSGSTLTPRPVNTAQLGQLGLTSNIGSQYGGWKYLSAALGPGAVVYDVGLGEDVSWDEGLLRDHPGLLVWGFDPTPKSAKWVEDRLANRCRRSASCLTTGLSSERFHFTREGLSTEKGTLAFTKPKDPSHVSMRPGELDGLGEVIRVPVNTLENWMAQFGHTRLDILKVDIEGGEYPLLDSWLSREQFPPVDQILIEWHFRFVEGGRDDPNGKHQRILAGLKRHGYEEFFSKNGGQEAGFRLKIRTEG
eukprot:COSAG01_NODE_5422_length_4272_cov_103.375030_3_plen_339_part_00